MTNYKVTVSTRLTTLELTADGMFSHETLGLFKFPRHVYEKLGDVDALTWMRIYVDGSPIIFYDAARREVEKNVDIKDYIGVSKKVRENAIKMYEAELQALQDEANMIGDQETLMDEIITNFDSLNDKNRKKIVAELANMLCDD